MEKIVRGIEYRLNTEDIKDIITEHFALKEGTTASHITINFMTDDWDSRLAIAKLNLKATILPESKKTQR